VWATAGPETFDCSGFTWWIASQVLGPQDYELRSSHHQFNVWGDEGHKVIVRSAHGDGVIRDDLSVSLSPDDPTTPSPSPPCPNDQLSLRVEHGIHKEAFVADGDDAPLSVS
jgi:hypothetical protein